MEEEKREYSLVGKVNKSLNSYPFKIPYINKKSLLLYNFLTMQLSATITSKRQLTIPAKLFKQLNFKIGQKVAISEEAGILKIEPMEALLDRLAGSVKIPLRFKGLSLEEIIERAKAEYFGKSN